MSGSNLHECVHNSGESEDHFDSGYAAFGSCVSKEPMRFARLPRLLSLFHAIRLPNILMGLRKARSQGQMRISEEVLVGLTLETCNGRAYAREILPWPRNFEILGMMRSRKPAVCQAVPHSQLNESIE